MALSRVVLVGVCLAALLLPASGLADLEKRSDYESGVTSYLVIQYSTTRCNGDGKVKMNSVSKRWHRETSRRKVLVTYRAVAKGMKCNGDLFNDSHSITNWTPCFGCDGATAKWTPDHIGFYSWPYLGDDGEVYDTVGAVLQTAVKNGQGETLGYMCLKAALEGSLDSPIC